MADETNILRQAYYDRLNGNLPYPAYNKFVPSPEKSQCYILIGDVSGNRESVKQSKIKNITISISVFSKSTTINPDEVMGQVNALVLDDKNNCLIQLPAGYQTFITDDDDNSQTLQLSPSDLFLNRYKTYTHKFFTLTS